MRLVGKHVCFFFNLALAQTDYSISNYTCTHVQTDRQTNTERETDRQADRQTDRDTDREGREETHYL